MMRNQIFAALWLFASAAWLWFWEGVRANIYERVNHVVNPYLDSITIETLTHYAVPTVLAGIGFAILWWNRSDAFRSKSPIQIFLERDSISEQYGIQTFPEVAYIQASVTASRRVHKCRAWITKVEYNRDGTVFSLEINERLPRAWSKHGGQNDFEVDLEPGHPAIRVNIAIFNMNGLALDRETPTNLLPLLQRIGVHRFEIRLNALENGRPISQTKSLSIDWRGDAHALVSLD